MGYYFIYPFAYYRFTVCSVPWSNRGMIMAKLNNLVLRKISHSSESIDRNLSAGSRPLIQEVTVCHGPLCAMLCSRADMKAGMGTASAKDKKRNQEPGTAWVS